MSCFHHVYKYITKGFHQSFAQLWVTKCNAVLWAMPLHHGPFSIIGIRQGPIGLINSSLSSTAACNSNVQN